MSEELLSNDRRVEKKMTADLPIHNLMHWPLGYQTLVVAILQP